MIVIKTKLVDIKENKIYQDYQKEMNDVYQKIVTKSGLGSELMGWFDWTSNSLLKHELKKINQYKKQLKLKKINHYVVIGIGGSYIGIKAALIMCSSLKEQSKFSFITGCDGEYLEEIINNLKSKSWAIIVISKSGKTLETSINFRLFRELLKQRYPNKYHERIYAITDANNGVLKRMVDNHNYNYLTIPNNIGGRFSMITAVGLFVMALANIEIKQLLLGWETTINQFKSGEDINPLKYAIIRYFMLSKKNKQIEVFATYNHKLRYISEQYKQLFAESEGKKKKCLIPTLANYSDDLHSIGQLYQQGNNCFFETTLSYKTSIANIKIPKSTFRNDDELNAISKHSIFDVQNIIKESVMIAHSKIAKIDQVEIIMDDLSAKSCGEILAFLCLATTSSAYLLKVNPFDQPGVEAYKNEIKKSLNSSNS